MTTLPQRLVLLASLLAVQSFAQPAQPAQERTNCSVSNPVIGHATCVKEARNARAEIRRGKMNETWQAPDFERHALLRCNVHTGDDKADCIARIQGKGRTHGSVAGGGILRELTTTKTVPAPATPAQAATVPQQPRPSGLMSNCRWVPPTEWVCK
jgi:hypothetical protein